MKTDVGITLLDTPGILWPKFDDKLCALNIASTGGIRKEILNLDEICVHILNILSSRYPDILKNNYGIETNDIMEMYDIIGKKINAYKDGETIYEKVSEKVYNDVVGGKIIGVTWDEWK